MADDGPPASAETAFSKLYVSNIIGILTSLLPRNEVPCNLRLVNKALAEILSAPDDKKIVLSQPVPRHAFYMRWGDVSALRPLTWSQRRQLLTLTARSGDEANLRLLLAFKEHCPVAPDVLAAAAGAGHLHICQFRRFASCLHRPEVLDAAAEGGHLEMCSWLLSKRRDRRNVIVWESSAPYLAARRGHVEVVDFLLQNLPRIEVDRELLLSGAAEGCDLPTMRRLFAAWAHGFGGPRFWAEVVGSAAASPTPDWQDKVEWLEQRAAAAAGGPAPARDQNGEPSGASAAVAACGDEQLWAGSDGGPRDRVAWLRQRGYSVCVRPVVPQGGDPKQLPALPDAEQLDRGAALALGRNAAWKGQLAVLQQLAALGHPVGNRDVLISAVTGGHLEAAMWVAEQMGGALGAEQLTPVLFSQAASSGSLAMMRWLHERGCRGDAETFAKAADVGSEEQLEWLAAAGCPMGADGEPYAVAAGKGDLSTLRCLRRLGCPWSGDDGYTFALAADHFAMDCWRDQLRPRGLAWLLQHGCPVDWKACGMAHRNGHGPNFTDWLKQFHQRFRAQQHLHHQHKEWGAAAVEGAGEGDQRGSSGSGSGLDESDVEESDEEGAARAAWVPMPATPGQMERPTHEG